MQNIVVNACEKFHYDGLINDRALGNRKSDNNNQNNVGSAWDSFPGPKHGKGAQNQRLYSWSSKPSWVCAYGRVELRPDDDHNARSDSTLSVSRVGSNRALWSRLYTVCLRLLALVQISWQVRSASITIGPYLLLCWVSYMSREELWHKLRVRYSCDI